MKEYDYIIVGSGLFGSVCAHELTKQGYKCLVLERRKHIGGNVYTQELEGINVHLYGPHVFHTDDKEIWDYVNQFVEFIPFQIEVLARSRGKLYNLPFNLNTFYQLWGTDNPKDAEERVIQERLKIENPDNLEDYCLSVVGRHVYETFIKEYTEKQWGRECNTLPADIIKRIPIRYTFDNNYYYDRYQGIPDGGYTKLIEKLLDGVDVKLGTDYLHMRDYWDSICEKTIFTGCIDEFYNYEEGELEYRSLVFEHRILETPDFQGTPVINHIDECYPYTRVTEHKHFEKLVTERTVVSYEYPVDGDNVNEPYYPVNDEKNNRLYEIYANKNSNPNLIFGGRLGEYKYYDMDKVIKSALDLVERLIGNGE